MDTILEQAPTATSLDLWKRCINHLKNEIDQQVYIQYLSALSGYQEEDALIICSPNKYIIDYIQADPLLEKIKKTAFFLSQEKIARIVFQIGFQSHPSIKEKSSKEDEQETSLREEQKKQYPNTLNPAFVFDNFVVGKSNQLAEAALQQVAKNPGSAYNPVFLYGGVGLGKTHLMHALGNELRKRRPEANVLYLHSERFVTDMIRALQNNSFDFFKKYYRSVDALLIDDIQFFSGKERSQEEFFHTFNALLEGQRQIILTSDRYPKEIQGIEERLQSRFGSGLTIAVEPPELETRVAILMTKAESLQVTLTYEMAFFIAKRIRSNVRELEGALKRVVANAQLTAREITMEFIQEALKDVFSLATKQASMDNIIKTVSDYYKIKMSEILSQKRTRTLARPRQLAMALCKELTNHSLPEIGDAFGGRDHTTVLHACRVVKGLLESDRSLSEDYKNLMRILAH